MNHSDERALESSALRARQSRQPDLYPLELQRLCGRWPSRIRHNPAPNESTGAWILFAVLSGLLLTEGIRRGAEFLRARSS